VNPLTEALKIKDQIITWRRDFHMYPELDYGEDRTSKIVEEHLKEWGYKIKRVKTGIIADIGSGKNIVALRADMDALPIQEENDVPYWASTVRLSTMSPSFPRRGGISL